MLHKPGLWRTASSSQGSPQASKASGLHGPDESEGQSGKLGPTWLNMGLPLRQREVVFHRERSTQPDGADSVRMSED